MEFTKEIKNNWLKALKSGEFKQGFGQLKSYEDAYCCIGVLGCITEGLTEDVTDETGQSPYDFLERVIGREKERELYQTNDKIDYQKTGKTDYSNVIPLIEKLETVD